MRSSLLMLCLCACGLPTPDPTSPSSDQQSCPLTASGERRCSPLLANVMLVVDRSGSMAEIEGAGSTTRLAALQSAMGGFLATYGSRARFGLTAFPSDATCGPGQVLQPVPPLDDA